MPRTLGHKFKSEKFQNKYDFWTQQQQKVFLPRRVEGRKASNMRLFYGIFDTALKVFRMGYLLDEALPSLIKKAREALPELVTALELGYEFQPDQIRDALSLALTVRLPKMVDWLANLPREDFINPRVETSEINYLLTEAMQAGARGNRKAFDSAVKKLRPALAAKRLIVSPRQEIALHEPVVDLLEAVWSGDPAKMEKAWRAKGDLWKKAYSRASEVSNDEAILDVVALGIARIAEGFGTKVPPGHPYAPPELLGAAT